jgi:hypothetical protein
MRNLIPFPNLSFPVFEDAVNRKTDLVSRNALTIAFPTLRNRFTEYDQLFMTNTLEALAANGLHVGIRAELLGLYNYDNAAINGLRRYLEQLQPKTVRYTCQYCSLEAAEEMDHVVGQLEFPEFTIHPKNLIPACSKCNRIKGQHWRVNNVKNLLNPYLDILPQQQYLFLDVVIDGSTDLDFNFRLTQDLAIDAGLWSLLQRHFTNLDLLHRMKREAITNLTEFQLRVRNQISLGQSRADITQVINSTAADMRQQYGANYWKAVFEEGLVNSVNFWNTLNQN